MLREQPKLGIFSGGLDAGLVTDRHGTLLSSIRLDLIFKVDAQLLTMFQILEVLFSAHRSGSHVGKNNIDVNFRIGGNNYRLPAPCLHIGAVISTLWLENEPRFDKDAFESLPVNGRCARRQWFESVYLVS